MENEAFSTVFLAQEHNNYQLTQQSREKTKTLDGMSMSWQTPQTYDEDFNFIPSKYVGQAEKRQKLENNIISELPQAPTKISKKVSDSSLYELSKRFIRVIRDSPDQTTDLQLVSELLGVPKRRIYDITNVLEGVGVIRKIHKNRFQWQYLDDKSSMSKPLLEKVVGTKRLRERYHEVTHESALLDQLLNTVHAELKSMSEDPAYSMLAYVTLEDVTQLKTKENDVLVVKSIA